MTIPIKFKIQGATRASFRKRKSSLPYMGGAGGGGTVDPGGGGGGDVERGDVAFVAENWAQFTTDTAVPLPAGLAENHIMIGHITSFGNGGGAAPAPVGWTLIDTIESGDGSVNFDEDKITVYWKRASASESSPTWPAATNHTLVSISAWSGCVTSGNPVEASQTSVDATANNTITITGLTTLTDKAMVLSLNSVGDDLAGASAPVNADLVSIAESYERSTFLGFDGNHVCFSGVKATAGAVGSTTASLIKTEKDSNMMIALTAAPV